MGLKRWIAVVTAVLFFLFIASTNASFAIELDEGLLDIAFEKLNKLESTDKRDAIDLLKMFFEDEEGLEELKELLPDLLQAFGEKIGENYEDFLSKYGLSMKRIKSDIDELKNWSRADRMKLIDLIAKGDKEGVKALIEKYEENSSGETGSPIGQPVQNQPALPEITVKFTDIENHWAKPYIEFIASKGIVKGKAEGLFAPEDKVTRAEFTAMLVRLLQPEEKKYASEEMPFSDVSSNDWYYPIIKTAYNAGLAKGAGDKFYPNHLILRQQMAVLITRAASFMNRSTFVESKEIDETLSAYKDRDRVSDWAKTEMSVAIKLGLIRGMGGGMLAPQDTATRAQAATVIYNLYRLIYE